MELTRGKQLAARLRQLVPGGCHTYAKGDDQYPELAPPLIARGKGCHVWDVDGNEFIEYGMGLRAVTLGHAYPRVVDAVRASLDLGTNFTRPAPEELACAEAFLGLIPGADMVKFTKDGSTAGTAALKLARRATGRTRVAICAEHPFFSYDDWFIVTTTADGGIPQVFAEQTVQFHYNDLASLRAQFAAHPGQIAAVFLEPARIDEPAPGFLADLVALCHAEGAYAIFDETITGFRWDRHGAQGLYGVVPDMSIFGKGMANGFSQSALAGKREVMRYGGRDRTDEDVFLLSTTHGAETPALVAAMATMEVYRTEPVVEHLHRVGTRLAEGLRQASARHGLSQFVLPVGRACNLFFGTRDPAGQPSQPYRTLFLQELIRRGVLGPSFVVSYSHTDGDIDRTIDAVDGALAVYARAMSDGTEGLLVGAPSRPVFGR
ncbi:MAG TPA: glutamate-1-semialdehyde 2,1-aminomutase, partial [Kofleriaceae bacterium]|nr:glutamate-1-semialdehyde 2,1-aminomutase [Kofleriaceae bacterium]